MEYDVWLSSVPREITKMKSKSSPRILWKDAGEDGAGSLVFFLRLSSDKL